MTKHMLFGLTTLILLVGVTVPLALAGAYDDAAESTCSTATTTHWMTIAGNRLVPERIEAKLCDRLVITNQDDVVRSMAFGSHDEHIAYAGVMERQLRQGQSLEVPLLQTGEFTLHDHYHHAVTGSISVR